MGINVVLAGNWQKCVNSLRNELPYQQFNTWIRPLQAQYDTGSIMVLAPNRFVKEWVKDKFLDRINELLREIYDDESDLAVTEADRETVSATGDDPAAVVEEPEKEKAS